MGNDAENKSNAVHNSFSNGQPMSEMQNSTNNIKQSSPTPISTTLKEMSSAESKRDDIDTKRWNWLLGLTVSCIPVFVQPMIILCRATQYTFQVFKDAVVMLLSNVSILYIAVALLVSELNDLEPNESKRSKLYITLLFVMLFVYTAIEFIEAMDPNSVNEIIIIFFNIGFLAPAIGLGIQQYTSRIR